MRFLRPKKTGSSRSALLDARHLIIAFATALIILVYLVLRYGFNLNSTEYLLFLPLFGGGAVLLFEILKGLERKELGADFLAIISIIAAIALGQYLTGSIIVLMLSGGEALEKFASQRAASSMKALSHRMPTLAHRKADSGATTINAAEILINDLLLVLPHELCPVDGIVEEGHGIMDESFLTGEPVEIEKAPGSSVYSGALNGKHALTIRATKVASDSRYARIMRVMEDAQRHSPVIRRLGDSLGALYSPLVLTFAALSWFFSGDVFRFFAVIVIATPCPLILGIPIAVVGAISLSAKRGIIIRNPAALEQIRLCQAIIFDKTGTLTYGKPELTDVIVHKNNENEILSLVGSLERYSRHPLALPIFKSSQTRGLPLYEASAISEPPGKGITGTVNGKVIEMLGRSQFKRRIPDLANLLPPTRSGLECIALIDGEYGATFLFHDTPRRDGRAFIKHLSEKHSFGEVILLSGDREEEVKYLANLFGIDRAHAGKSPEEKTAIVSKISAMKKTIYVGDGINDAPALAAATVGIALGQNSDITTEAADIIILDPSLEKIDEVFHIGQRMRSIALETGVGGMMLSVVGVVFAALGLLPALTGAILQEIIDLVVILNALRMSVPPKTLVDYR